MTTQRAKNSDAMRMILLTEYQAELIEEALAYREDAARSISDDLILHPHDAADLQHGKEFLADATAMFDLRQQLVRLFGMGHVDLHDTKGKPMGTLFAQARW